MEMEARNHLELLLCCWMIIYSQLKSSIEVQQDSLSYELKYTSRKLERF